MNLLQSLAIGWLLSICLTAAVSNADAGEKPIGLRLNWQKNILSVEGDRLHGGRLEIWYIEAYCRPDSTDRDWRQTTIGHSTRLVSADDDGQRLQLACTLNDGVVVEHDIHLVDDGVEFQLVATNNTDRASLADWAQPCIRVDGFTGRNQKTYLEKSFVFYDGELTRMPTPRWATEACYVPGQIWCPKGVDRNDVNPRPLSDVVPSNGLIGCYSAHEKMILATAWEPYQEMFQGVIVCLHSDFRIGGLEPGESKQIRGKIYLVDADVPALVARYRKDFPEHAGK